MTPPVYKTAIIKSGPHVGWRLPRTETTPPATIKVDYPPQSTYQRKILTGWDYDWASTP